MAPTVSVMVYRPLYVCTKPAVIFLKRTYLTL